MLDTLIHGNYVYAGFHYEIHDDGTGRSTAIPHEGQHRASLKEKHRRAACEQFDDEYKWKERIREY